MKFFLDTANLESIKKGRDQGLIDGVTTNPTHLSKEGGNILDLLEKICQVMNPDPVSVEITELDPPKTYEQAKKLSRIAPNVLVKVPCHKNYLTVIKRLVDDGIFLNITLVFSLVQALAMCKLGVAYVSPFIGRLDDIDSDGIQVIYDIREMIDIYDFKTQLLAASLRSVRHLHEVTLAGADVATIPVDIFEKIVNHPLTDKGIKIFDEDWKKLGIKSFP